MCRESVVSRDELTAQHRHGLAAEAYPFSVETHAHHAAARRRLIRDELLLAEFRAPVRGECAVRRAGDRIFRDAGLRREESRHEVVLALLIRQAGDDDAARVDPSERIEIGLE